MLTNVKSRVKKILLNNHKIDHKIFFIFFYTRKIVFQLNQLWVKIDSLSNYNKNRLKIIKEKESFISVGPKTIDNNSLTQKLNLDTLGVYKFDNAIVHAHSSCILYNNRLIVDSKFKNERYNEGYIVSHGHKRAIIRNNDTIDLEDAIFLGGNGSWNWYHFLIEIAPKLIFKNQIPCKHILLSDSVLGHNSMQTVIDILLKDEYKITYMESKYNYRIKNLYHINNIAYVPFNNLNNNEVFGIKDVYMHRDILMEFRNKLMSGFAIKSENQPKNIFFKRRKYRVAKNQEELINVLKKYDFEAVFFEELTLEEQIKYVYNAEFIIGTTGAAWTNILFANPNLKAICFMQDNLMSFSCYSNMANIFGVDLNYYFYNLGYAPSEHYRNGYELDINKIESIYLKLINEKTKDIKFQ